MKNRYRSIFISDIHLGTKDCKADLLCNFLKHNSANTIYLIGDIIDGWRIQSNNWKWKRSHTNVIRHILNHSKKGTKIVYVIGNHDEFLRPLLPYRITLGKIEICNKFIHFGVDDKRYLVIHGDLFDGISTLAPWVGYLGDKAYDLLLYLNTQYNWIRHKCGFGYWSFSKFLKHKVKGAVDFIFQFEKSLVDYCKRKKYDGVIAGHIHHAEIKDIDGVIYMNDGDWVESCTALVEHFDGTFEIIHWDKLLENKED